MRRRRDARELDGTVHQGAQVARDLHDPVVLLGRERLVRRLPRIAVEVRTELAHRQQQCLALERHALQMSLDAFAVLFGDGQGISLTARLLAGRGNSRPDQLRHSPSGATMTLCTRDHRCTLDIFAGGDERRPRAVTVDHGASVVQDVAEQRRVVLTHVR